MLAESQVLRFFSLSMTQMLHQLMVLRKKYHNEKVLVFDLGGGMCLVRFPLSSNCDCRSTFILVPLKTQIHLCVLRVSDSVFDVLSTSGDSHLRGDVKVRIPSYVTNKFLMTKGLTCFLKFKQRIVDWLAQTFQSGHYGVDVKKKNLVFMQK